MNFPFTQDEWKEILQLVYKRASNDHQFHVLCERDAHAAIKLVCGKQIPKGIHIRFEPQKSDELVLILPQENKVLLHNLSDHDLDDIAESMANVCIPFAQTLEIQHQPRGYS
ncbi:MAG: hypothetical protein S4CHLAM123_08330 [Chlamydiales bacterium]|nr:hypothetical protein [Chlamydiales bacterium]